VSLILYLLGDGYVCDFFFFLIEVCVRFFFFDRGMCAIWGRLGLKVDIITFSPFPSSPVLIDNLPSRL
jgi:hypothetical protein